jgi:hypothetical protein
MLIRVRTDLIIEVEDEAQAEHISSLLDSGLDRVINQTDFPCEVIEVDVDHFETVSEKEAKEQGWTE